MTTNNGEIKKQVLDLLNRLDPIRRIEFISDLFTSNLVGKRIDELGENALRFQDLEIGDMFIFMPGPGDDSGHGGLKGAHRIFVKIEGVPDKLYHYGERDNAKRLTDGVPSTMTPGMHVIKVL